MLFSFKNKYNYTYLNTYIALYFRTPKLPVKHTNNPKKLVSIPLTLVPSLANYLLQWHTQKMSRGGFQITEKTGEHSEPFQPGGLGGLIDLCDFWHVAKRRSHQAIQRIYISVHHQKLKIKYFIKTLRKQINRK